MTPETRWLLNTARLIGEAAGALAALPDSKELLARLEKWGIHDNVFEALQYGYQPEIPSVAVDANGDGPF